MPQRILRDWTKSEKVDALSAGAEVFFIRLIMRADDFGRYRANPKVLRADLFPLREIELDAVLGWLVECRTAGLLTIYGAEGKDFLEIVNFGQRLRVKRKLHPDPEHDSAMTATCQQPAVICQQHVSTMPATCGHMSATCGHMTATCPPEVEDEVEEEVEVEQDPPYPPQAGETAPSPPVAPPQPKKRPTEAASQDFEAFWTAYPRKTAKAEARKAWEQKKEVLPAVDELVAAIACQVRGKHWSDPKYIPHASTWLRGERWSDETDSAIKSDHTTFLEGDLEF